MRRLANGARMTWSRLVILMICSMVAGCATPRVMPDAPYTGELPLDTAATDAAEAMFLAEYPELARRNGDWLRLQFRNGARVSLKNRDSECESFEGDPYNCYRFYSALGYWSARDIYLVQIGYYEGRDTIFLLSDGAQLKLLGTPKLSPDGQYFVDYANACDGYGNHAAFAIWKVAGSKPRKIYQQDYPVRPTDGEFGVSYRFTWIADTAMQTQSVSCAGYDLPALPAGIVRLDSNDQWRWDFEITTGK